MNKVVKFDNKKQYLEFVKSQITKKLGEGTEGRVYLTNNNDAIKVMLSSFDPKFYDNCPNIIMEKDMKLDSFIFPQEIYTLNGLIAGYKQRAFLGNIFDDLSLIDKLDVEQLIKARKKIIEDMKVLTDYGYRLYNMPRNILFNNDKLVAIDTLDYEKKLGVTLKENIKILDYSLLIEMADVFPNIIGVETFDEVIDKIYTYNKYIRK